MRYIVILQVLHCHFQAIEVFCFTVCPTQLSSIYIAGIIAVHWLYTHGPATRLIADRSRPINDDNDV